MNILPNKWYRYFFFQGCQKHYLAIVCCLLGSSYLGLIIPGFLLELNQTYENKELFFQTILSFSLVYLAIYGVRVLYQLAINYFIKDLMMNVRNHVYSTWLFHYEAENSKKEYPQGEVIARIMSDTESLKELVTSGAFGILMDFFYVLSFLIGFLQINKFSGIFLGIVEVLVAILLILGGKYMREIFHQVRKSKGFVSATVSNLVGGMRQMYFIDHHQYASQKGKISFDDFLNKQLKANSWDATYYSLAESLYPLFLALIVFIFPYSQITEAAVILALVELIQRSINPIKGIAGKITNIQNALTGLMRIEEFRRDLSRSLNTASESRKIEFSHLRVELEYFSYFNQNFREKFSLKSISFKASRGEMLGIVGLSGSGKSTLLNLISANLIPEKGKFFVYENNDKLYATFPGKLDDISRYREQVGIVGQESHIFSETLIFNITLKKELDADFNVFWEWVKGQIAYLKEWKIEPDQMIDPLALSPGQKQLLSAIRSCYLKKTIVLLDEISSSLDSSLEFALRKMIGLIQKNSLVIIVAHRLETVLMADNILVMDEGRVVAEGDHQGLIKSSKNYRQFIDHLSR